MSRDNLLKRILVSIATLALASCSTTGAWAQAKQTRTYVGDCVFGIDDSVTPQPTGESAILAAIASAAIKVGFDSFGKALRAAGEAETTTVSAQRNVEFKPGKAAACIQFVSGSMGSALDCKAIDWKNNRDGSVSQLVAQCERLRSLKIFLTDTPDFFVELQLRPSSFATAYTIAPTYYSYQRMLRNGKYDKNASRALALQARIHGAGVEANASGSTGGTVVLGMTGVGTEHKYLIPDSTSESFALESAWFPALNPPVADPPESGTPEASDPRHPSNTSIPLTVTVSVSETRSARPFYLFLADVFDETKDEVQAETEKLLIKSKRDEAELAAYNAKQTLLLTADEKLVAAEVALISYCTSDYASGSDAERRTRALQGSGEARAAQVAANVAARAAGKAEPFPTPVEISDEAPAPGSTGGC